MEFLAGDVIRNISNYLLTPKDLIHLRCVSRDVLGCFDPGCQLVESEYFAWFRIACNQRVSILWNFTLYDSLRDSCLKRLLSELSELVSCSRIYDLRQEVHSLVAFQLHQYLSRFPSSEISMRLEKETINDALSFAVQHGNAHTVSLLTNAIETIQSPLLFSYIARLGERYDRSIEANIIQILWRSRPVPLKPPIDPGELLKLPDRLLRILVKEGFPLDGLSFDDILFSPVECSSRFLRSILSKHRDKGRVVADAAYTLAAVQSGDLKRLKALIEHNAKISPEDCLIQARSVRIMKFLIEKFSLDINLRVGSRTLLSEISGLGDPKLLRSVLGLGLETGGLNGYRALLSSIGLESVTMLLLSHGADINFAPTSRKETILHVACQTKVVTCGYIEFLLKNGANVNAVDVSGTTPLMTSVSLDRLDVTGVLLRYGAIVDLIDFQGDSAISIAESLDLHAQLDLLHARTHKSQQIKRRKKNTYYV